MSKISKEQFCKIVDGINNDAATADIISNILRKDNVGVDFFDPYCLFDRNVSTVISLLETMFDDEDEWISYWCYECMGDSTEFEAYDEENRRFYIKDSSDLYELIVNDVKKYYA